MTKTMMAILISLVLAGCEKPKPPEPTVEQKLNAFVASTVTGSGGKLTGATLATQTLSTPIVSYVAKITTHSPEYMLRPTGGDDAVRDANLVITRAWQEQFCTSQLKALLQETKVDTFSVQLVDGTGLGHSVAVCMKT
ncbi:MAG: hypothetical protein HYX42_21225 [Polaromonas sp.]|uniref:hypothetical protein n=1 Tax=Polaromonas sp. TaxID=1869339 RepID=UPI0025D03716|nr:hypothetical protein [Polaromonas sp.]MBI2728771.1 hypothetical protein [Polaromonas sp.]